MIRQNLLCLLRGSRRSILLLRQIYLVLASICDEILFKQKFIVGGKIPYRFLLNFAHDSWKYFMLLSMTPANVLNRLSSSNWLKLRINETLSLSFTYNRLHTPTLQSARHNSELLNDQAKTSRDESKKVSSSCCRSQNKNRTKNTTRKAKKLRRAEKSHRLL